MRTMQSGGEAVPRGPLFVKIGSSSLAEPGAGLSTAKLEGLVLEVMAARALVGDVVLVSSGAVAAGLGPLGLRPGAVTRSERQAAAAVGQARLMEAYRTLCGQQGVEAAQVLICRSELENPRRVAHLRRAVAELLRRGALPIVNENDTAAADELRFGDNDTLAALLAVALDARLLVLLTDIDGLYDADPRHRPQARRIAEVRAWTPDVMALGGRAGTGVGSGGMRTKLRAARIASDAGIDTVVTRAQVGQLAAVLRGESVGTRFRASPSPGSRSRVLLRYGARPRGRLILDDGAVAAVERRGASLLAAGVLELRGAFEPGDVVELATAGERVIGRGTALLGARDLARVMARRQAGQAPGGVRVVHHRAMVLAGEERDDGRIQA